MHLLDRGNYAWAVAFIALLVGCKTERSQQNSSVFDQKGMPPAEYYVHCETCHWCKGPYKKTQDVQQVCTSHNVQKHDYFKVAYYDGIKCKR